MGPDVRPLCVRRLVAALAGATLVAGAALTATPASATPAVADESGVDIAFDFGGPATPVADGWVGVHPGTAYSADAGYGFTNPPAANGFRDRGGDDAMARDFTIGNAQAFAVDVPDGTYEVTTWAGDLIAGNGTNFDVEGTAFTGPRTTAGQVHEELFPAVEVTDGQLNVRVTGGDGRINGIRVQTPLPAPAAVAASVTVDPIATQLTWQPVAAATGYAVFRAAPGGDLELLGETAASTFTDTAVELGETYRYAVASTQGERRSRIGEPVDVAVVDPSVAAPAAPAGLTVGAVTRDTAELSWSADDTVAHWRVLRSTRADLPFTEIATVTEPAFTDTGLLTTRPYLYRVVAVNAGGHSPESETVATPIATTLVREVEYLDRAPVAVDVAEGVYLGWRLLGLDDRGLAFTVYRDGERITDEPITGATNLVDPDGTAESRYLVTAQLGDREVSVTEEFGVWSEQFLDIPVDRPAAGTTPDGKPYTYAPGDASVGDLDGDGEYEIVFAWNPSNYTDNSISGYTGNVYLDAIELDGTQLWRIDLGVNIRAGSHYTQFQVFDLDGDGRSEVAFKTADGTIDGAGTVIGDAGADHRNERGYILEGPEFLTVFDGRTGAALDTTEYVPPRGNVNDWGDNYANRADRFLAGVAYLDGEHPSLIASRGYYTRAVIAAWDFRDGRLQQRWVFDSDEWGEQYEEQGNHQLATVDVDRDGLDEIVFGAMTIDDDGSPLYNSNLFHGDAMHVGDHDPARPGQEIFGVFENPANNGGTVAAMRDAETGEVLWSTKGTVDTGRGTSGDIDPRYAGNESWSIGGTATWDSPVGALKSATGELIDEDIPSASMVTWWDGDLLREIADHDYDYDAKTGVPQILKWDHEQGREVEILRDDELLAVNGTKGTPMIQADLLGDWREEVLWPHADFESLRLYTTTDVTEHRIPTLMHDPQYRQGVAWQNTAYNQPPHPSYFLGEGMGEVPAASIAYVAAPGGPGGPETDVSAPVISGLPNGTVVADAPLQLAVGADDPESGIRSLEVTFDGEPVAPDAAVDLTGLAGEVAVSARATNHAGLVAEATSTVLVVPESDAASAPSRGTLSTTSGWAQGLHDGTFDVVMNLWWGTPGSVFRLYEDGTLVATEVLDASGTSQHVTVPVTGRGNGTYVYTGELINARGATATTATTVTVTDAAPGTPVVSHDDWDRDGSFTATADLWWGTNATSYRFELDGVVVGSGELVARTPWAQRASVSLTGVGPGEHELVAVFVNAHGETASKPVRVRVR